MRVKMAKNAESVKIFQMHESITAKRKEEQQKKRKLFYRELGGINGMVGS